VEWTLDCVAAHAPAVSEVRAKVRAVGVDGPRLPIFPPVEHEVASQGVAREREGEPTVGIRGQGNAGHGRRTSAAGAATVIIATCFNFWKRWPPRHPPSALRVAGRDRPGSPRDPSS